MNAKQQVRYLELENRQLRDEANQLRKKLKINSRHAKRVQKAFDDALLMVMWHCSGIPVSRRYTKLHGISQNRWENAMGLLRMARIVTRHRHWITIDLATAEARLRTAKERATNDRELYRLRLTNHALQ